MCRKRIGILMSQPESAFQSQFLKGFLSEAFRLDYDVSVFATFLRTGCSEQFQIGETNIYNAINYNLYDGFVVLPYTLLIEGLASSLLQQLKTVYHGSVIVADAENDLFSFILNRDDKAIQSIVEHVITVHNCRNIAFMTGPEHQFHSKLRLKGYLDAMEAHGLEVKDKWIFYADFWYDKGEEIVSKLLNDKDGLPDAICCASEPMALCVIDALSTHNIKVPKDIIVTGYDADGDGLQRYHEVTSLPRRNTGLGLNAMRMLHAMITGNEYIISDDVYSSGDLITSSCGCNRLLPKLKHTEQLQYHTVYDHNGFESGFNFMLEDMIAAPNLRECLWTLSWYTHYIGDFDAFYLAFCENWVNSEDSVGQAPLTKGYTDTMILAMEKSGKDASVELNRSFSLCDMLPALFEERAKPSVFYFTPLHFNESCIGYSVLSLGECTEPYNMYYSKWSRNVNNALESIRRQSELKLMYGLMEQKAETDSLTGLYNRNGFYIHASDMLMQAREENLDFLVISGDLNCMKHINDTYGHSEGDSALILVAAAFLEATKDDGGKSFRTGGDEFIYLGIGSYSKEKVHGLIQNIRATLSGYSERINKPYSLFLGIGSSFGKVKKNDNLDAFLMKADASMFKDKKKIKTETGFNFSRD